MECPNYVHNHVTLFCLKSTDITYFISLVARYATLHPTLFVWALVGLFVRKILLFHVFYSYNLQLARKLCGISVKDCGHYLVFLTTEPKSIHQNVLMQEGMSFW